MSRLHKPEQIHMNFKQNVLGENDVPAWYWEEGALRGTLTPGGVQRSRIERQLFIITSAKELNPHIVGQLIQTSGSWHCGVFCPHLKVDLDDLGFRLTH